MTEYYDQEICIQLSEKYQQLASLIDEVCAMKTDVRKLKNHPINKFPDLIFHDLHFQWEARGIQKYLLADVFEFVEDFRGTRNGRLKDLTLRIDALARDILNYDSIV